MACCMFAAFIVGNILMMWQRLVARISPVRAAAQEAYIGAAGWRPGQEAVVVTPNNSTLRRHWAVRPVGALLIMVSMSYFTVQANDAYEQTSDARSFAVILAQNICRVKPDVAPVVAYLSPIQIAATQPQLLK